MGEAEKETAVRLFETMATLPENVQNWILGYAEGWADTLAEYDLRDGTDRAGKRKETRK